MVTVAHRNLLSEARSFISRTTGKAALLIAPLAAVELSTATAKAQTIFHVPSGGFTLNSSGSSFVTATGPGGTFFTSALTSLNGITGMIFGGNVSYSLASGGGFNVARRFRVTDSGSGPLTGETIPVAYSFTLGSTTGGSITSLTWSVIVTTNTGGLQSVASGSNLGSFAGSGTYLAGTGTLSSYTVDLFVNYTSSIGATLAVTMDSGAGQGIALNATAIPEPATYAGWAGVGALLLAGWRRVRRRAQGG